MAGDYRNAEGEWLMDAAAIRFEAALDEESRYDSYYDDDYGPDHYDPSEYTDDTESDDTDEEDE
jgi:hypothetical protein